MRIDRVLIASTLLCVAASASSQLSTSAEGLQTLRGFRIGDQCQNLDANFEALREEGFKVAPARHTCFLRPGEFFVQDILHQEDGKSELLELSFAPNSVLWRIKVSITWEGIHRLSMTPTPEQAIASLENRFGKPLSKSAGRGRWNGMRDGASSVNYTWSDWAGTAGQEGAISAWTQDDIRLKGTVTQAALNWWSDSSRQTLVVEMTNRQMVPLAVAAGQERARKDAASKALTDGPKLNKL